MSIEVQTIWLMESEYCGNCDTALSPYENTLCYDCQQDEWYNEDQDFYDGWFSDWDIPVEETGKP